MSQFDFIPELSRVKLTRCEDVLESHREQISETIPIEYGRLLENQMDVRN